MKNHDQFLEMLARRRELSDADEQLLRQHLTECEQCWQLAEAYQDQTALLKSVPVLAAPLSLRPRVLAGARQVPPHRRHWLRRPALLLAPMAAACLIAVLVLAQRHHSPNGAALSRHAPRASSVPARSTVKSHSPAQFTGKSGRPAFKPFGPARGHAKAPVQAGAISVAQVLRTTPSNALRPTISTGLDSAANVRSRLDLPYQGAAKKAYSGNTGHSRTTPRRAAPAPASSPAPQPTSAAVIRAGPPQTALKPIPPVQITTPTPQPTPVAGSPKATPEPPPKP